MSDTQSSSTIKNKYTGIKAELKTLIEETTSSLSNTVNDKNILKDSFSKLTSFEIITWEDRLEVLSAYVKLCDLYATYLPQDEDVQSIADLRNKFAQTIQVLFGEDSLHLKVLVIVAEVTDQIKQQLNPDQVFDSAFDKLSNLELNENEVSATIVSKGIIQLLAIKIAIDWFKTLASTDKIEDPITNLFLGLVQHLNANGFDKKEILHVFDEVEQLNEKHAYDFKVYSETLIKIYGWSILYDPHSAPSLEKIEAKVFELITPYLQQKKNELSAKATSTGLSKSPDKILLDFKEIVARDGFSEYALNEAITAIKQLPQKTLEEIETLMLTMNALIDAAIPIAPQNVVDMLNILKTNFANMFNASDSEYSSLTVSEFKNACETIVKNHNKSIADGVAAEAAFIDSLMKLQFLAPRLPKENSTEKEDEEIIAIFLRSMLTIVKSLKELVPPERLELWAGLQPMFKILDEAPEIMHNSELENDILIQRLGEQTKRLIYSSAYIPVAPEGHSIPQVKQFNELLPALASRFGKLQIENDSEDKIEFDRLSEHLSDVGRLLGSAYTLDQLLQHQKMSFRRMAIELGQFERRYMLMLIKPIFPANEVTFNANAVFFSGSGEVSALVAEACNELQMIVSQRNITDNYVNARWQQLRESALAIFDYSNYNPAVADPSEQDNVNIPEQDEILAAAGPIANVAYENGWAYVFGKPLVIIMQRDQTLPFDVDIEPVVLQHDGNDASRILAAIQIALYSVSRATQNSCIPETINFLKVKYAGIKDKKISSMLNGLEDSLDATHVRLTISVMLEKMQNHNHMIILPAFPGAYPDEKSKLVFHITAFRKWSINTQEIAKAICTKRNLEYKIGYERLNPNILASIWKDICQSSFVIADLTNLNPNATLELAMAQAVGCPTLIISQHKELHKYFLPVQKMRTHFYDSTKSNQELSLLLENFFDGIE
ncbi:MAG: hypothetical protein IPO27_19020 [Bacteroidetes bacterium]|nr:hypothetical protein [Bacteroidota bacterium]